MYVRSGEECMDSSVVLDRLSMEVGIGLSDKTCDRYREEVCLSATVVNSSLNV